MNVQQFARCTGISPHTVRYYEKLGLLPGIGRSASGHRIFCPQDITWMGFILRLKSTGMPLQDIQAYAVLRAAGDSTLEQRQQMLQHHATQLQQHLQAQQHCLTLLQDKIVWYQNEIVHLKK